MSTVEPPIETRRPDPLAPAVARWVHYVESGQQCLAALVVNVDEDGLPTLRVFSDLGPAEDETVEAVPFEQEIDEISSKRTHGTWHWPVVG